MILRDTNIRNAPRSRQRGFLLNPFRFGGAGGASYEILKSLRLRASSTAYLYRSFGSGGNRKKWTWSAWVKVMNANTLQGLFLRYNDRNTNNFSNYTGLFFDSNQIKFRHQASGATVGGKAPSALLRDPTAWFHVLAVFDTANATAANRMRIWLNGVEPGSYSENVTIPLNTDGFINQSGVDHDTGVFYGATRYPFDGYLAENHFIDGQALDPSYFGEFDGSGVWMPKAYVGTYGTTGYYLPFFSGGSLTALAGDQSGLGNNWTTNAISLTAGVDYDQMDDTPTNNFTTLNTVDANGGTSTSIPTKAGLTFVTTTPSGSGLYHFVGATQRVPASGKWYFEFAIESAAYSNTGFMYVSLGGGATYVEGTYIGSKCHVVGSTGDFTVTTWGVGDVLMCAIDADAGKVWWGRNGTWFTTSGSPNPAAGTGAAHSYTPTVLPISVQGRSGNSAVAQRVSFNFGQRPFSYTPPTGFNKLCTANLTSTTITTSGTFTGNANAEGPCIFTNGVPTAMTINGNAVTFGTHADKLANGFKLRTNSASYNASGSNTYSITATGAAFKNARAQVNP